MAINSGKKINLLYISSDNNASSGAFLSMVKLCSLLQEKFDVNPYIILPYAGNGQKLLEDNNLQYEIIRSEDWIVPVNASTGFTLKKLKKQLKNIFAFFKLIKLIKSKNIDIVHINTIYSYVGAIAAMAAKTPFIWHIREILEQGQNNTFINEKIAHSIINQAAKIISISKCVALMYPQFDKKKTEIIYNGIDTNTFYKKDKTIFNNNLHKFICTGEIYPKKGQFDLVRACKKLEQKGIENWKLDIIGQGDIECLQKLIEELKLTDRIKILGYKQNVADYMSDADISFMTSHCEAFGRVTVEAMMAGCLVIGANSGGTPEIITTKETGLLYQTGDIEALAETIKYAITNTSETKEIARNGQLFALNRFTAEKNAAQIHDLYTQVLERNI